MREVPRFLSKEKGKKKAFLVKDGLEWTKRAGAQVAFFCLDMLVNKSERWPDRA